MQRVQALVIGCILDTSLGLQVDASHIAAAQLRASMNFSHPSMAVEPPPLVPAVPAGHDSAQQLQEPLAAVAGSEIR